MISLVLVIIYAVAVAGTIAMGAYIAGHFFWRGLLDAAKDLPASLSANITVKGCRDDEPEEEMPLCPWCHLPVTKSGNPERPYRCNACDKDYFSVAAEERGPATGKEGGHGL